VICRFCSTATSLVNTFGSMPIANGFHKIRNFDSYRFNLETVFCDSCKLFQLAYQPKRERMFNEDYPFFTSQSKKMQEHFGKLVSHEILPRLKNNSSSFVVEIGSNDGTLLATLKESGINHLGIDPSASAVSIAESKFVNTKLAFFSNETAKEIKENYGPADIVVAANVICHLPDIKDVFTGVFNLLNPKGVFIFEEPYLMDMINKVSFDQLYDEHVYIFSLHSIKNICSNLGLRLYDAEHQTTHGGSMRYFVTKDLRLNETQRMSNLLIAEKELGLDQLGVYIEFSEKCKEKKLSLTTLLKSLKDKNFRIAGYGATSKSTTILNYCQLSTNEIDYICDSTPEKIGSYSPGSGIPIISIEEMRVNKPDFMILFAWNHEFEIFEKERDFLGNSVKWIGYIPEVKIY